MFLTSSKRNRIRMAKKYYSCGELMEAIRGLDYKKKYEVLKAFYLLMIFDGFSGEKQSYYVCNRKSYL